MNKSYRFFNNLFLATGAIWLPSGLSIVCFNLHFREQEIMVTLILPVAYAIVKIFDDRKVEKNPPA